MIALLLKLLTIVTLLVLFFQDLRSRSVHWVLLPGLTGLFISARWIAGEEFVAVLQGGLTNLAFIFVQLSLVSLYFSIKNRKWVNITRGLLGWGDMLFLAGTAFLFPPVLFIFFYLASLALILLGWSGMLLLRYELGIKDNLTIPLAGLQALLLAAILSYSWLFPQSGVVKFTREVQTLNIWS